MPDLMTMSHNVEFARIPSFREFESIDDQSTKITGPHSKIIRHRWIEVEIIIFL